MLFYIAVEFNGKESQILLKFIVGLFQMVLPLNLSNGLNFGAINWL
jgi:hypothetical protein